MLHSDAKKMCDYLHHVDYTSSINLHVLLSILARILCMKRFNYERQGSIPQNQQHFEKRAFNAVFDILVTAEELLSTVPRQS